MAGPLLRELLWVAAGLALLAAAAAPLERAGAAVGTGLLLYLGWHLVQIARLLAWLADGRKAEPPEAPGLWGEVFDGLHRLQGRNRKRKKKLAKIIRRFQESTRAIPDATVVVSPGGEIEWFNDAAGRLLGLKSRDLGAHVNALLRHPDLVAYLQRGAFDEPVEIPAPADPARTLSVVAIPIAKRRRLLMARDVTRLKRLERIRRDFVANVSHELRTPLTVMTGHVEALSEAPDGDTLGAWRAEIQAVAEQTTRMRHLVEDLLELSRLEGDRRPPPERPVAVAALAAELAREARLLSGPRRHRIEVEADEGLVLLGAEGELRSAFANLVHNAVQYTPDGGRITIRWGAEGDGAVFVVTDTGIGIPAPHIPRLTERFYRVDVARSRESGGTGLGLAIVRHVLARHGARLEIESAVGRGSTFRCRFDAARVRRRAEAEAAG
ncbi:phosphate regulon sensor histidine kinase PhoR [Inmirania thermothiophila]|uniref:Phosphate regulon sensor protein PhoR n=1 Tax=Inmirania thermothiophila TaxID=1750597 RepID=A0A3N1YBT0_9GAMM|nr:phosphate regulon sensor histidine kinase PhoR [Inmirania thermothiophila]ROR35132.1 PAS/PAC sensor signal transduction histidine kinase [Inmirania thermothiophila]